MMPINRGIRGEVSEVRRSGSELWVDWRIPGFLGLPCGGEDFYDSPHFGFHDERWHLRVYPNWYSSGKVSIFLHRDHDDADPSSPRRVTFSWGLRGSSGGVEKRGEEERELKSGCWWLEDICKRSELMEQEERLMPGGTLTFVCQMKVPGIAATGASSSPDVPIRTNTQTREPNACTCKCQTQDKQDASTQTEDEVKEARVDDKQYSEKRDASTQTEDEVKEARVDDKECSEKRGIEKVAEDMGKLFDSNKRCDVTVQVQEAEFRVHSSVLCARSPVLSAMLEHDTAERASHRITIDHCQPDVFEEYLRYLYTGSVKSLSRQTVFGLYRVADQYLADDLKRLCLEHIQNTLCVETFCDTVTLAVTHGESDLLRLAVDFATQNFSSIVISVEWQNFIREYPGEANEILVKCFGPRGDK